MTKKPSDHIPLDIPKIPAKPVETLERETRTNVSGSSKALERVGEILTGSDGKRYVASFAVHVYETGSGAIVGPPTYVTLSQTTDITALPETIARHACQELTRSVMIRYGHKPPTRRDDAPESSVVV